MDSELNTKDLSYVDSYEHLFSYKVCGDRIKISIPHTQRFKEYLGITVKISEETLWKDVNKILEDSKRKLISKALERGYIG